MSAPRINLAEPPEEREGRRAAWSHRIRQRHPWAFALYSWLAWRWATWRRDADYLDAGEHLANAWTITALDLRAAVLQYCLRHQLNRLGVVQDAEGRWRWLRSEEERAEWRRAQLRAEAEAFNRELDAWRESMDRRQKALLLQIPRAGGQVQTVLTYAGIKAASMPRPEWRIRGDIL